MNRIFDSPFLLRQGEPGTSQYIWAISIRESSVLSVLLHVFYPLAEENLAGRKTKKAFEA